MTDNNKFPVVGIGASAGGVEALGGFFRTMPDDTGMAFVLVMHMPIGHETTLPDILRRMTTMAVSAAKDGEAFQPNHVYVCPADEIITASGNRLRLTHRTSAAQAKPIDVFFASLAEARGDDAVGVILSGAGSDGTLGLKAIKERGGLTLAQGSDGNGPKQSGMPDTAIATGVVDLILPVEAMAERLVEFAASARELDQVGGEAPEAEDDSDQALARQEICTILLQQIGHDFSGYKEKTFMRRTRRRMQLVQAESLNSYIAYLNREPDEVTLLFRDLLIGVTNFFRDKDAFDALENTIIPRLFEGLGAGDTVRIWVPGCSTGEEVYSLGILIREHLSKIRNAPKVQLFATDIDEGALSVARAGRYPEALLGGVTPERLKRFFVKDDASFLIAKDIRDLCIFSSHSVVRDPPFSRIDLISCRNLLIYLGTEFQARVIPVFHFALRPGGYLFLGASENIGQHSELFQRIDRQHRVFQRRDHAGVPIQFPLFGHSRTARAQFGVAATRENGSQTAANLRRIAETRVLDQFAPAHVIVNRDGDVVHYSARTGKYLEAAAGFPTRQLVTMARRGLRPELRAVLQEAMEARQPVVRDKITLELEDRVQAISLRVEPLGNSDDDPLFLVLFTDVGAPVAADEAQLKARRGDAPLEQVEHELRETRERLQAMSEDYETALEELKASNEEMVSVNEELQSTNEELETSKEELQSVNEELQTVNVELSGKVDELDRANDDLRNLFESTRIATLFLDENLIIRSFTPAATSIFNLISTDRGRPLSDIVSILELGDLKRDVRWVIESTEMIERNVRKGDDSRHFLMRILPYRARHNLIEGVIVTFFDVTKMIEAEAQQRMLVEELNHRVKNMLAVIAAITTQTLKRSSAAEAGKSLLGRIQVMSNFYSLMARENWTPVELADLLKIDLDGHAKRATMGGPAVVFPATQGLSLGLIFHELTSNAAKFGALSNGTGKLAVEWRIDSSNGRNRHVVIGWRESGGPPVKAPTEKGLGNELIDFEIKQALRGSITRDYAKDGLKVQITVPLDATPRTGG